MGLTGEDEVFLDEESLNGMDQIIQTSESNENVVNSGVSVDERVRIKKGVAFDNELNAYFNVIGNGNGNISGDVVHDDIVNRESESGDTSGEVSTESEYAVSAGE